MKRKLAFLSIMAFTMVLSACWSGEIGVDTVMDADGAGHRDFYVVVYDESLSDTPIINPNDPDGAKGNGPVLNVQHIEGGIPAIQDWLEDNTPAFLEVLPMRTEGVQRIFTVRMTFDSFEDFLGQYEQLVDLSPNLSWSDFTDAEKPTLTTVEEDGLSKVTLTESNVILQASFDWAIDGIYNSIFLEASLAGFVDKTSLSQFATYNLTLGEETLNIVSEYDPAVVDSNGRLGQIVYIDQPSFTLTSTTELPAMNTLLFVLIGAAVVAVAGGAYFFTKKKAWPYHRLLKMPSKST